MAPSELLISAENLLSRRKLSEALRCFNLAGSEGADSSRCSAGRWTIHMLRGDFPAAWAESDAIRNSGRADPNCLWRGEKIYGKRLIVRCLHGFGDAVQFFRYAPQLNAIAESIIWQVPPEMMKIARCFCGVNKVISWEQKKAELPDWEVQIECMQLPNVFRTRFEELPIAAKYLRLPRKLIEFTAMQMNWRDKPRIGLVWAAGEWNRARSIPLEFFSSIVESSGCEFWNLQGGAERYCEDDLPSNFRLSQLCNSGILRLAAVIAQLDLIVTVDTLAAHLAGALGVSTWLLLQHAADWRWMIDREDSPWYPSLRLFRQPSPGDWRSVLREVETALLNWIASEERSAA